MPLLMMMMMRLHLLVEVDGYRFVKLAYHLWCPQCLTVLLASGRELLGELRILGLLCLSVALGCLRRVGLLLFFL